jgi:hypothetical protein
MRFVDDEESSNSNGGNPAFSFENRLRFPKNFENVFAVLFYNTKRARAIHIGQESDLNFFASFYFRNVEVVFFL